MTRVFFYGLFMDADLLRDSGFRPVTIGRALVRDYELRIGKRAALVPAAGKVAYGMLIELADKELSALYSAPGVSAYRPIDVEAERLEDGSVHGSVCYNLPADALGTDYNAEYANTLSALLLRLGFPSDYARAIADADT